MQLEGYTMQLKAMCKVKDACQHMTFGERQVVRYGWNKGACVAVWEVRMADRNNHIIKVLSHYVVGRDQIYP